MANEEEVVRVLLESTKLEEILNDSPTKDLSKDFGGDAGVYVQQRVACSFELDDIPSAIPDFLLQFADAVFVEFAAHAIRWASITEKNSEGEHTYTEDNTRSSLVKGSRA